MNRLALGILTMAAIMSVLLAEKREFVSLKLKKFSLRSTLLKHYIKYQVLIMTVGKSCSRSSFNFQIKIHEVVLNNAVF